MPDDSSFKIYTLSVYPQEARKLVKFEVEEGQNLFFYLNRQGYSIASSCGGVGTCGKCRVLLHEGAKNPTEIEESSLSPQEIAAGWRLSCQQWIDRDLVVTTPLFDKTIKAKEELEHHLQIDLNPGISKSYLKLPPAKRGDQRSDTKRLKDELAQHNLDFSLHALRNLPYALRGKNFSVTVTWDEYQILDIESGNTSQACYGLVIDIGTTTLAVYLLNLLTGEELAINSQINPQHWLGSDVIARIKHVHETGLDGIQELKSAVTDGINSLVRYLCDISHVDPNHIYKVSVVGNPTMLHLFAAISPSFIDRNPYTPVLQEGLSFSASQMNLEISSESRVYILPAISGYVGSDISAGVLFSGLHQNKGLSLFVDIGTNAEIVLGNCDKLLACSVPAGPAFEGAHIKHGMNASPGAINYVFLNSESDQIKLQVIGGSLPKGICGSGLIDLVSELVKVKIIDGNGEFRINSASPHSKRIIRSEKGEIQFLVDNKYKPIYLTQRDIRELQLVKGAVRASIEILLSEWGAQVHDLEKIYMAGALGNFMRRESALRIGMLPPFPVKHIKQLGNAAGQGGKMVLLNQKKWGEVQELSKRVSYLELSYRSDFSNILVENMLYPCEEKITIKGESQV